MSTYTVLAEISTPSTPHEWSLSRSVPTFKLESDIQGLVSLQHAADVARDVVDPFHTGVVSVGVMHDGTAGLETFRYVPDDSGKGC